MLRDKLMHHEPVDGFRWRSHEITRVEGFSDAVFGFAVTLLIVSLEVPHTSTELLGTMRGFGAFVITFFMLSSVWYRQFMFFRRYGLEDRVTVVLNLALLFVILFFVYPLKFLFNVLLSDPRMRQMVATPHGMERVVLPEHRSIIFAIFGAGFCAIMVMFLLLYRHAYKQREALELNEFELFETRHTIRTLAIAAAIGATYFLDAGLNLLPDKTAAQKRIVIISATIVIVILVVLLFSMFRMRRHRNTRLKEWKAQSASRETQH